MENTDDSSKKFYVPLGMAAPPTISCTTVSLSGLEVDVYGIDELKPERKVNCLWLLHPRLQTRAFMHDIACRTIHAFNEKHQRRGLVAFAFDMRNHGSRLTSDLANKAWAGGNDAHAVDMEGIIRGSVDDMKALMDLAPEYLHRTVADHACLGVSLGGHAAWQAIFGDKRVTAAVPVIGCPDYTSLMSSRAAESKLDCGDRFLGSRYFPPELIARCAENDPKAVMFGTESVPHVLLTDAQQDSLRAVLDARLRGKKLLACSGGKDTLVPYSNAKPVLTVLSDAAGGWYKDDLTVLDKVYPDAGHEFSKAMVLDSVEFLVDHFSEGASQL